VTAQILGRARADVTIGFMMGPLEQDLRLTEPATEIPVAASRIRSSQTWVLERLREGEQRSTTLRRLVTDLGSTDVIVYVEPGIWAFGNLTACLPHAMTAVGGIRYLRVIFDNSHSSATETLAHIGHQLQHVVEIANAPEVRTPEGVSRLF